MKDEELQALLNADEDIAGKYTAKKEWHSLGIYIMDLSLDQLFETFLADDAEFGFDHCSKEMGHSEIVK